MVCVCVRVFVCVCLCVRWCIRVTPSLALPPCPATVSDFHSAPKLFVDKHHPMRHKGPAARKPKTRSIAFGHIELDNRTAGYHGRGPDPSSTALVVHPTSHSHSHSSSSSSHSSKMPMIGRTKTKSLRIKGGNKTQSGPHYPWMADPNNPDTQSGRRKTHVGGGMSNKAYEKILADTVQSMQNQLNDVIKENETLKKANTSHLIELDAVSDEMVGMDEHECCVCELNECAFSFMQ
jgi:hypothetical protein